MQPKSLRFVIFYSFLCLFFIIHHSLFLVRNSFASVPRQMSYQGKVTSVAGVGITDTLDIAFSLWDADADAAGDSLWGETQINVPIIKGLFDVKLGAVNPLNLNFDITYYLQIIVDGDILFPRSKLATSPYAFRAAIADSLIGGIIDKDWRVRNWLGDGVDDTTMVTGGRWGLFRRGNRAFGDACSTHVNLGVACTTGTSGENYKYCTVGGGNFNKAKGIAATVSGGKYNSATDTFTTVSGGYNNEASNNYAVVSGGNGNNAKAINSVICGGTGNLIQPGSDGAWFGSGFVGIIDGIYSAIPTGYLCHVYGDYSFAFGNNANVNSDYTARFFTDANPGSLLVGGTVRAHEFIGGGSGLTDVDDADWVIDGTNQYSAVSGQVGVGIANPAAKLHVQADPESTYFDTCRFNFERGLIAPFKTYGDELWFITTNDPYGGEYCIQSGDIGDSETTSVEITVRLESAGSIFCNRNVSCDSDDRLAFYIDGVFRYSVGGLGGTWGGGTTPISAGIHTLKWSYEKDGSGSGGSDRAKLDNIRINGQVYIPSTTDSITFYSDGNNLSPAGVFMQGYVGIGTENPTSELSVVGNIEISGHRLHVGIDNNVGIGTSDPGWRLEVNGNAAKPGGGSWTDASDRRLKDIHMEFNTGLAAIMTLQPVSFSYKQDNPIGLPSDRNYIGLIAQEVQKVIPEAIETTDRDNYLYLNNDPIIWTMLNAIKEQQKQIEELRTQNAELHHQLEAQNQELINRIEALENQ